MDLSDVIGNLGGVQQVVIGVMSLIFTAFSNICLVTSMINYMYVVKTDDKSLNFKDKKLQISTFNTVRLMTKIFANKKMKRFIKKGIKRL